MTKMIKIALAALVMITMSATTLNADVTKGQKLYLKKLKGACGMNGAKMAAKHTQMEWEMVKDSLADEIKSICPNVSDRSLKEKYLQHYFDFFYEYASDSGNVPSC